MADYIKKIKTKTGDKQIDYTALANLPVSDKTLSKTGEFADAAETGKIKEKASQLEKEALNLKTETAKLKEDIVGLDNGKADAIVETASGNPCNISDSSGLLIKKLNIYGESTQEGTPSPDVPVPIISKEISKITVTGKELEKQEITLSKPITLRGVKVSKDGNIVINGQMYLSDVLCIKNDKVGVNRKILNKQLPIKSMNNGEDYPGWKNLDFIDLIANKKKDAILHNVMNDFTNIKFRVSTMNELSKSIYTTKQEIKNTQSQLINTYPNTTIDFLFELLSPIFEPLPQVDQDAIKNLHSYYPNTTIECGAWIEVEYVADTKEFFLNQNQALQNQILEIQNALISQKISGGGIKVTDSAKLPIQNLRIFGKSEQVQTTGKNILDIDSAVKAGWNLDITNITHFVAGETYTMSVVSLNDSTCGLYLDDSVRLVKYIAPGKSASFVMPDKATFTKMSLAGGSATALTKDISKVKIQIEKGESATSFEIYTGGKPSPSPEYPQEVTIAGENGTIDLEITGENVEPQTLIVSTPNGLPGLKVDKDGNYTDKNGQHWLTDEIDLARGKYVQRIKKKIFDGTEQLSDNLGAKTSLWLKTDNIRPEAGLCNYGKIIKVNAIEQEELSFSISSSGIYLYTTKQKEDFIKELKQKYDSGNPVCVMYALKTPIETDLQPETISAFKSLHTNYPTTSVSNNGDAEMELTYTADTRNYIDQKIEPIIKSIVNTQIALL